MSLLEREPGRFEEEQTHLFAAMDQAYEVGGIDAVVRVEQLAARLEQGREDTDQASITRALRSGARDPRTA